MFERFSRSARMAIVIAQEDARELRSPTIEVEHVLLGLLSQCEAELRGVLAASGLTHAGVTQALADNGKSAPLGGGGGGGRGRGRRAPTPPPRRQKGGVS
ncbi:Clp protease N-terminal domain-containing protein [Nocardia brasiliensis]|uniref:Clp protease N-terminal domain-containing protein n=1 Tax=Nocardia brasiliensis TaxID=37326 RepID=UPI00245699E9|nr:Clp protease N-terminal domain-containing protein [Nocardia brasiliensis]